jgi:hypothetical protein
MISGPGDGLGEGNDELRCIMLSANTSFGSTFTRGPSSMSGRSPENDAVFEMGDNSPPSDTSALCPRVAVVVVDAAIECVDVDV